MDVKTALILDAGEPLSKAVSNLMDNGTAVVITKENRYCGIVDDRNIRFDLVNANKTRCETVVIKAPTLTKTANIMEQINAFLSGHFKALAVTNENGMPEGIITRVEVLKEMHASGLLPKIKVTEIMNSPVYTIDENETLGKAKGALKEHKAHRLIVTKRGNPVGMISTLDFTSFMVGPKNNDRMPMAVREVQTIENKRLADVLRPNLTTVTEESTTEDVAKKMIDKTVSSVVVLSNGKPVGVISALDIFKRLQGMAEEKTEVMISGLDEDHKMFYQNIKESFLGITNKFSKGMEVTKISVHIKEKKSMFTMNVHVETDMGTVSLSSEKHSIKELVNELCAELDKVLIKKKEMRKGRSK